MNKERRINVLMVGPSLHAQGGIAAVVNQYIESAIGDNVAVHYLPTISDTSKTKKMIDTLFALFKYLILLPVNDIVHVHMASRNSYNRKRLFLRLAHLLSKKTIIHLHGGQFDTFFKEECTLRKQKQIIKTFEDSNCIITLSSQWRDKIIEIIGDSIKEKVRILNNSVKLPESCMKDYSDQEILFLGRLVDGKGVSDMIEAMKTVHEIHPTARLNLCGGGTTHSLI